jgi:hypothetical protein
MVLMVEQPRSHLDDVTGIWLYCGTSTIETFKVNVETKEPSAREAIKTAISNKYIVADNPNTLEDEIGKLGASTEYDRYDIGVNTLSLETVSRYSSQTGGTSPTSGYPPHSLQTQLQSCIAQFEKLVALKDSQPPSVDI